MSSKKPAAKKTDIVIETLNTKSIDEISADLLQSQSAIRNAFSQIGDTLLAKKQELDAMNKALQEKAAEFTELSRGVEIVASLEELKEQYADAKHEHERALKALKIEFEDEQSDLIRQRDAITEANNVKWQREDRERAISLEDEDRRRRLAHEELERALNEQKRLLDAKEAELGQFEARVATDVAKQVNAIKKDFEYQKNSVEMKWGAEVKVLAGQVDSLNRDVENLRERLGQAEDEARRANERANAIATAAIDAESGKKALEKVEAIAQKQAESGKR